MTTEIALKIAKVLAPVLIGAIIGGAIAGWIQQTRLAMKETELAKVQGELAARQKELTDCQDANATSQATIGNMKAEMQSAQKNCTARLRQKEHTAAEITRIDNLKPEAMRDDTKGNAGNSGAGDPILDALNGMFIDDGKPADRKD